jgi:hypothetical protein
VLEDLAQSGAVALKRLEGDRKHGLLIQAQVHFAHAAHQRLVDIETSDDLLSALAAELAL